MSRTLTDEDIAAIARATAAELRANPPGKPIEPEVIHWEQAMVILNCKSKGALQREVTRLGIKTFRPGHYWRRDITNAIARHGLPHGR